MSTITNLPSPPSTGNPANFDTEADAFIAALPNFVTETNIVASEILANRDISVTKAAESQASADASANSATASATSAAEALTTLNSTYITANVTKWLASTNYTEGDSVWSPVTFYTYRRKVTGTSGTDPSLDPTNWELIAITRTAVLIVTATSVTAAHLGHYILTNVAATTVNMPATPVQGDTVSVTSDNGRFDNLINFNGQNHMDKTWATDPTMTLDNALATVTLRFLNTAWRII